MSPITWEEHSPCVPAARGFRTGTEPLAGAWDEVAGTLDLQPEAAEAALHNPRRRLKVAGVVTATGRTYHAASVVLTTGTFLRGRIIMGEVTASAGRAGEAPSIALAENQGKAADQLQLLKPFGRNCGEFVFGPGFARRFAPVAARRQSIGTQAELLAL